VFKCLNGKCEKISRSNSFFFLENMWPLALKSLRLVLINDQQNFLCKMSFGNLKSNIQKQLKKIECNKKA
jgi:hypothetical protein